jgi:hypothetical protein
MHVSRYLLADLNERKTLWLASCHAMHGKVGIISPKSLIIEDGKLS